MSFLSFNICLLTDTEPGTGLGSVNTDNYIPRDHLGRPVIPASHIKGLMREELQNIKKQLALDNFSYDSILGKGGKSIECEGIIKITGPIMENEGEADTLMISRTAIHYPTGTALDKTLRTTQALAAGSVFTNGGVQINAANNSVEDIAVRFALRAISSIGGNRNRGSGRCRIEINGENRGPGELLKAFHKALSGAETVSGTPDPCGPIQLNDEPHWIDIIFRADQPVCCPENPTRANAIQTGFSIPASAVMGTLLHRVNNQNSTLADACFTSDQFRTWPLLPCAMNSSNEALSHPVRVSLTHKIAKLTSAKNFLPEDVQDLMFDPNDVYTAPHENPLKAYDGVLLGTPKGVVFWKSSEMPRVLRAHGALNSTADSLDDKEDVKKKELYQMTAMTPLVWRGQASIPGEMLEYVCGEWNASFGKHRGTMGSGRISIKKIDFKEFAAKGFEKAQVIIAQSPILLPRDVSGNICGNIAEMIGKWCKTHGLPSLETGEKGPLVSILAGVCFGWNRHADGYAGARKVVKPGSVFRLKSPVDTKDLEEAFRAGLGMGRNKGFGALAVHPGKAGALLNRSTENLQRKDSGPALVMAVKKILPLRNKTLPSVSQIYALISKLETGGNKSAIQYLGEQTKRDPNIAAAWQDVISPLKKILKSTQPDAANAAASAMRMLANIAGKQGGADK